VGSDRQGEFIADEWGTHNFIVSAIDKLPSIFLPPLTDGFVWQTA
jgi:hypothetical protein